MENKQSYGLFTNQANSLQASLSIAGFGGLEANKLRCLWYCQWGHQSLYTLLPYINNETEKE